MYNKEYYTSGNYKNYLKRKFRDLAIDLANEIHFTPDKKLLDYGCGYGGLLYEFWNMPFEGLCGTDISDWIIDYGKKRFPCIADKLHHHDINLLKGEYDFLFLLDVLEHMPEEAVKQALDLARPRECIIARIPVAAREGGKFVLDASNSDPTHLCCHARAWWLDLFRDNGYEFKGDIQRDAIYSSAGVLSGKWKRVEPVMENFAG
tara:strand:- start:1066 stop:1680 length:615 start_codon:yes stop_codon:yes gene_type:complete